MQHFMIPCDFGGRKAPFPIYVGEPKTDAHPLHYQSWWLSSERGGSIPQEVMDSFEKLHKIALENNVSFEELCVYAMGEAMGSEQSASTTTEVAPPPPPLEEPEETAALQQQAQPVNQPPQAQPLAQTHAQQHPHHENHQDRMQSEAQSPDDPYRNNQG
jgi:hypothetical protein